MRPRPRQLARPGLSLVDANKGRLVTYQEDVLDIKGRIKREWPGVIDVFFDEDPSAECWVITQTDKEGTESVLFTTKQLSESTIDRIRRADQVLHPSRDPLKEIEKEEAEIERDKDRRFSERVGEAGERLFLALRKDGVIHTPKVFMSNSGKRMRGVT